MDELKIALPAGETLSFESARRRVANYLRPEREGPASDLYDGTNAAGPHDEVDAVDLLALNALNAFAGGGAMTHMAALWKKRSEVGACIRPVTKTPFQEIPPEQLDGEVQILANALKDIDELGIGGWGGGGTRVAKLVHRLRPNIMPLYDVLVGEWFTKDELKTWESYLKAVYGCLKGKETKEGLVILSRRFELPPLRIWDILLWNSEDGNDAREKDGGEA